MDVHDYRKESLPQQPSYADHYERKYGEPGVDEHPEHQKFGNELG
jgi:hypothetical protein